MLIVDLFLNLFINNDLHKENTIKIPVHPALTNGQYVGTRSPYMLNLNISACLPVSKRFITPRIARRVGAQLDAPSGKNFGLKG
ncbi:hypothetical protein CWE07_02405 [Aliidiomarina maris]|uniref:HipA-like protein n=1 Tax=Aliidiomarina maris TaxID=531312 RepID=A0ABY0BWJ3_9GAMM|nr:hypothetical protein CWE07_02405 [Aliidiomarina maris]